MELYNVLRGWYCEDEGRLVISKLIIPNNAMIEVYENQKTGFSRGTGKFNISYRITRPWYFLCLLPIKKEIKNQYMEDVLRTFYRVTIDGNKVDYYEIDKP